MPYRFGWFSALTPYDEVTQFIETAEKDKTKMSNWLTNAVNTAKRIINVSAADVSKVVGVVGKDLNTAIKLFIKIEPVAVTVLTPFAPAGAAILSAAYSAAESVESYLNAPGATKQQMATDILTNVAVPAIESGLNAAGKTIDVTKVAAVVPDLFNAIVAENNAQGDVSTILAAAASSGTIPDPVKLAAAESAIAVAVAQVKTLGLAIQSAVGSVTAAPVVVVAATK